MQKKRKVDILWLLSFQTFLGFCHFTLEKMFKIDLVAKEERSRLTLNRRHSKLRICGGQKKGTVIIFIPLSRDVLEVESNYQQQLAYLLMISH